MAQGRHAAHRRDQRVRCERHQRARHRRGRARRRDGARVGGRPRAHRARPHRLGADSGGSRPARDALPRPAGRRGGRRARRHLLHGGGRPQALRAPGRCHRFDRRGTRRAAGRGGHVGVGGTPWPCPARPQAKGRVRLHRARCAVPRDGRDAVRDRAGVSCGDRPLRGTAGHAAAAPAARGPRLCHGRRRRAGRRRRPDRRDRVHPAGHVRRGVRARPAVALLGHRARVRARPQPRRADGRLCGRRHDPGRRTASGHAPRPAHARADRAWRHGDGLRRARPSPAGAAAVVHRAVPCSGQRSAERGRLGQ
ncbi:hypothetical protein QFZ43_004397 [Streptomyces afghaniensis]|nr:hypothetical protein [Streptomyces afghaniensis]